MSYSVCKHGGKMCDGCMACYDDKDYDQFEDDVEEEYEIEEDEEEEEEE